MPSQIELAIVSGSATVPVVTLLAVFLATIGARRRAWETVILATVAGLIPWAFILPYAVANQPATAELSAVPDTTTPSKTPLRVMLVNADQGRASAIDITTTATANNVDILVVTELTNTLAHDLTTSGLARKLTAVWVQPPGGQGEDASPEAGTGVWTRAQTPKITPIQGTYWPAVRLTLPINEATVDVAVGHVDSPQHGVEAWARDLRLLREATTGDGTRLVIANLNATAWNGDLRDFTASGLSDAADVLGQGPRPTWPTWSPIPLVALDHVMVGGQVEVQQVQTVDIEGSDHRALVVGLTIPPGTKP